MTKQEFLAELRARLSVLPVGELEERIALYGESIDDRIEEGLSEKDAVTALGTVDKIAAQILAELPLAKIVKERERPKKHLGAWATTLLAVGSPIWLVLLIAAFAVLLSVYISLWTVVVSLWATFGALVGTAIGGILGGTVFALGDCPPAGLAVLSAGLVCAGLSIFGFYGCRMATKGAAILSGKIAIGIKIAFVGKESSK